jgi:hypothetical protein
MRVYYHFIPAGNSKKHFQLISSRIAAYSEYSKVARSRFTISSRILSVKTRLFPEGLFFCKLMRKGMRFVFFFCVYVIVDDESDGLAEPRDGPTG